MEAPFINLQRVFYEIYTFSTGGEGFLGLISNLKGFLEYLTPISTVISLIILTGIVYVFVRIKQIRKEETEEIKECHERAVGVEEASDFIEAKDKRWLHIKELSQSENMNDWRQAILNADIMLYEMLSKMGYVGDSIGEMLKSVNRTVFKSLNSAWEAHKVRNKIAHEGGYILTERRAKEAINMYGEVFREFNYISSW